jgi:short subunit dehydrogenase-like uncharacterized protein
VSARQFDLLVFGATGFTGRLVVEYLLQHLGEQTTLRWGMVGRSAEKLDALAAELGVPASVGRVVADAADVSGLNAVVASTRVMLTTVGPYQLYGEPLVAACAALGTDYVDLCGEPAWMRFMIDRYEAQAKASGARIVFSCGFDSIPFDLGVWALQNIYRAKYGQPSARIKGRVRKMKGTFSGGTAASLKATMAAASDPQVLALLRDPFSLTPGFTGPAQPSGSKPAFDEKLNSWAAPFVMAAINTRNVHRSNALLGHAYGTDFVYDEMLLTGPGEKGEAIAKAVAADKSLGSDDGPKPGEGPSREERETGFYDVLFIAETPEGGMMTVAVAGDRDPGYGSTSKMIAQSALCLLDAAQCPAGGVWTPAAAFGQTLVNRLEAHAGLSFKAG